jgi:molybdopterin converting factor small subunit
MKIKVKLIGPLIYEAGFSEKEVEVAGAITAGALLKRIALIQERPKIMTRNGRAVAPEELLEEGDRIAVSPIYSGG